MKILNFKLFIESKTEEEKNISKTLKKIPKSHCKLIDGYKFKFNKGNTLHKDDKHIGVIDPKNKKIILAAPWNYGREFTFLHELAHKVWETYINDDLKKEWIKLFKEVKNELKGNIPPALNQNPEEIFCHAYATTYCNTPPEIFCHNKWKKFIKNIPS